jgi:hypothetical protein
MSMKILGVADASPKVVGMGTATFGKLKSKKPNNAALEKGSLHEDKQRLQAHQ